MVEINSDELNSHVVQINEQGFDARINRQRYKKVTVLTISATDYSTSHYVDIYTTNFKTKYHLRHIRLPKMETTLWTNLFVIN